MDFGWNKTFRTISISSAKTVKIGANICLILPENRSNKEKFSWKTIIPLAEKYVYSKILKLRYIQNLEYLKLNSHIFSVFQFLIFGKSVSKNSRIKLFFANFFL